MLQTLSKHIGLWARLHDACEYDLKKSQNNANRCFFAVDGTCWASFTSDKPIRLALGNMVKISYHDIYIFFKYSVVIFDGILCFWLIKVRVATHKYVISTGRSTFWLFYTVQSNFKQKWFSSFHTISVVLGIVSSFPHCATQGCMIRAKHWGLVHWWTVAIMEI